MSTVANPLNKEFHRYIILPDATVDAVNIGGANLKKTVYYTSEVPLTQLEAFIRTSANKNSPTAYLKYERYNPTTKVVSYDSSKYIDGPSTTKHSRDSLGVMGRPELEEILRSWGEDPSRKNDDWIRNKIFDLQKGM